MQAIALVTGGNKGIGRETARRLAEAGQTVYIGARDESRGQAAADELGVGFVRLDVTDEESVVKAAAAIEAEHGRLDVLVNNAGIREPAMIVGDDGVPRPNDQAGALTGPDAATVFDTNVVGVVRVLHAFLPLLERSSEPVVVNVSSGMGSFTAVTDPDRPESGVSVPLYSATKAAVSMLTLQYSRLLPAMKVNAVDPGLTATDFTVGLGHSVEEAVRPIIELATAGTGGPTGTFVDHEGPAGW